MKEIYFSSSVKAVGDALLYFNDISNFTLENKEKDTARDLVSSMDMLIQKFIEKELEKTHIPFLSEEMVNDINLYRKAKELWVLDPIDGTTNFIHKIKYFGIALGLIKNGIPVAGVFGMPETKELFYTISENTAYLNEVKLNIINKDLSKSLIAASFSSKKYLSKEERNLEFQLFGEINDSSRGCLRMGSATVNICYTAASRFGACYGHNNFIWDIAAGVAIAKAAGCEVYLSNVDDDFKISYVIGAPDVAKEIKDKMENYLNISLLAIKD